MTVATGEVDLSGQYPEEQNTHWHLPEAGRQLTLFDLGALRRLEASSGLVLPPELTRRNVLVSGLDLNPLVGMEVSLMVGGSAGQRERGSPEARWLGWNL